MTERQRRIEQATAVLEAIRTNDAARLWRLLESGASPNGFWDERFAVKYALSAKRALANHLGLREGHPDYPDDSIETFAAYRVRYPSARGELHEKPSSYFLPLHWAAENDTIECMRVLLAFGADVHQVDDRGETALFVTESLAAQRILLDAGVDPLRCSGEGGDALQAKVEAYFEHGVRSADNEAQCRLLLELGVPLVRSLALGGRLYHAAFGLSLTGVRLLLDLGHPLDAGDEKSPLHGICWHWDGWAEPSGTCIDIIRALVEAGIDVNMRDAAGRTPLHEALTGDGANLPVAAQLILYGADVNAVDRDGMTPLHLHYEHLFDYPRVVPFMLERGADPLIRDRYGRTVLDIAEHMAAGGKPQWLIEHWGAKGVPCQCAWKSPAEPGDGEMQALEMLERYAQRHT